MDSGENEIQGYISVDDGYAVIGYHYHCHCGNILRFVGTGDICECGFILPPDPDDA